MQDRQDEDPRGELEKVLFSDDPRGELEKLLFSEDPRGELEKLLYSNPRGELEKPLFSEDPRGEVLAPHSVPHPRGRGPPECTTQEAIQYIGIID